MIKLDRIDRYILAELQKDGRIANNILAQKVGLSPSPCLRRVKMLENCGAISRYAAVINPIALGLELTVYVRVWLTYKNEETINYFTKEVSSLLEIIECHFMIGECDFLLKVLISDLSEYCNFELNTLARIGCVKKIQSEIPMKTIKPATGIPISHKF